MPSEAPLAEAASVAPVQLDDQSMISVAMAGVRPSVAPSIVSDTESMSSSTFGGSVANESMLRIPEGPEEDKDEPQCGSNQLDEQSASTLDSPSLATSLAIPTLPPPPILRSLSVQCESAEDLASLNFSHKLTFEADRVIQQLHVFEQLRTQDKAEVKGILLELLDIARREPVVHDRWQERLDRSVGGSSVAQSPLLSESFPAREAVDRSVGGSVITAPSPRLNQLGVDRSVGGSVLSKHSPDRMRSGIDRSVGGSVISASQSITHHSVAHSQAQLDITQSIKALSLVRSQASPREQAILLTPPPQRPMSTGSMSYLSSHYSDELELGDQDSPHGPEVEPVSPSWASSLSDQRSCNESPFSDLTEEVRKLPSHVSQPTVAAALTSGPLPEEQGDLTMRDIHVEPPSEPSETRSVAPLAADYSSRGPGSAAHSNYPGAAEVVESIANDAGSLMSLHMPKPVRANEPIDGQLAHMLGDGSPATRSALLVKESSAPSTYERGPINLPVPDMHTKESSVTHHESAIPPLDIADTGSRSGSAPHMQVESAFLPNAAAPRPVHIVEATQVSSPSVVVRVLNDHDVHGSPCSSHSSNISVVLQENLARLQQDNMRLYEEQRRVNEEHRLAQEELKTSLARMNELLVGLVSKPAVSMSMPVPHIPQFTSPLVFSAQVPPLSMGACDSAGRPSYPLNHATPSAQSMYLLPQMTPNFLPPPPFGHAQQTRTQTSEVVEPVIPPYPSSSSSDQPSVHSTTNNVTETQGSPLSHGIRSLAADASSPVSSPRADIELAIGSEVPFSPSRVPLPSSIVTIASHLPTPALRLMDPSSTLTETPCLPERLAVTSPVNETSESVHHPTPVIAPEGQPEPATTSFSGNERQASPPAAVPSSPLSSAADAEQQHDLEEAESGNTVAVDTLPPTSSLLFQGTAPLPQENISVLAPAEAASSEAGTIVVIPPSSSSTQTSPVTLERAPPFSPADKATSPVQVSMADATPRPSTRSSMPSPRSPVLRQANSPRTISASTSPILLESTVADVSRDDAAIQAHDDDESRSRTVSTSTSPLQPITTFTTSSQTDHAEEAVRDLGDPHVVSACTSPIQQASSVSTPAPFVERALSPISHAGNVLSRAYDHAASQTEVIDLTTAPLGVLETALSVQDDSSSIGGSSLSPVDMRRSSWNDTASMFRSLVESTQTTAREALEILHKTQALLDEAHQTQEESSQDNRAALMDIGRPSDEEAHDEELSQLREEVVALKACLDDVKASSHSQLSGMLDKLTELQGLYEREAERRELHESEQAAQREQLLTTLVAEKEHRIGELESLIAKLTEDSTAAKHEHNEILQHAQAEAEEREAAHLQKMEEQEAAVSGLRKEIETLQAESIALRAQREQDEQLQTALEAEREEAQAEQDHLAAQDALEKEQLLSERDACISALRESLEQQTVELQRLVDRETELAARDTTQTERLAEQEKTIESLKCAVDDLERARAQANEEWEGRVSTLETEQAEKEQAAAQREAELQQKIDALQQELETAAEDLQKEVQRRLDEISQLDDARAESEKAAKEAALEREKEFVEKYDAAVKEFKEELVTLRAAYENAIELQKSEAAEQRETDREEARERAEHHIASLSELRDKLLRIDERSEEQWTQQWAKHTDIATQLDKMEDNAAEERRKAEDYRSQRDEERAEAASKPSVQSIVEERLQSLSEHIREQLDSSADGVRADLSRQHEVTVESVNNAVHEQTSGAFSNALEEMSKQLQSIEEAQHTHLLDSMKGTIEEQITRHISYYLGELGKLMDTQHVQQLSELLEVVRSTMQEQVIYNVENYLDDLCRQLVPEISQLLKEVREKAEEKNHLNRQIDCLRDIKREHEPGGRLYDSDSGAANHPGLKEFNKKAWRKHKSKSADPPVPAPEPEIQQPVFEAPKQPIATYPVEVSPQWDSWSERTLSHPPSVPPGQVALYVPPPPAILPPMASPSRLTPQTTQMPYHGL
ncbi:hypothetical protein NM688_g5829 [Phlebia brevispora]|uniref:Uncharacterized protein n=1 Tax=Phlebia brevispora TaxID=194682 RepID=A0ACC1SPA5_9APHY|nr:hypothetical protein NM688_g5829 [Phlebia brevispora]